MWSSETKPSKPWNLTQYAQVRHLVDHAVQSHGRIDVIVNNAGLMPHSPLERVKVEEWDLRITNILASA